MDNRDSELPDEADFSPAVPMEIPEETAARADDLLREFAEDAGLETVLVVDRSGALVAGISSEADVTVEVISALVAGASGAMRALVAQLGETGAMESLHLGGNRLIYLKETVHRFVLVAVAEVSRPAGLVRQKALAIEGALAEILRDVRPVDPPAPEVPPIRSLREIARERAALRNAPPPLAPLPAIEPESADDEIGGDDDMPAEYAEEPGLEERFETFGFLTEPDTETQIDVDIPVDEEFVPFSPVCDPEPELAPEPPVLPEPEPKEILEPLDFGEPEIVIEGSAEVRLLTPAVANPPIDSPFEADEVESDLDEDLDDGLGSIDDFGIFEVDEEEEFAITTSPPEPTPAVLDAPEKFDDDFGEEEEDEVLQVARILTPVPPQPIFEAVDDLDDDEFDDEFDDHEFAEEESVEPSDELESRSGNIFEFDEDEDLLDEEDDEVDDQVDDHVDDHVDDPDSGPFGEDDDEDIGTEIEEMISEEDEESEIRSSGPFYF